eukprot:6212616-Pleurochrysis_carterae.AAC.2
MASLASALKFGEVADDGGQVCHSYAHDGDDDNDGDGCGTGTALTGWVETQRQDITETFVGANNGVSAQLVSPQLHTSGRAYSTLDQLHNRKKAIKRALDIAA